MAIHKYLKKIESRVNLSEGESSNMQEEIINGAINSELIIKIFEAFEQKGITADELSGIVTATRKHMIRINVDYDVLDTCGTGGDGLKTFNISTISAIVCAAAGIPVAKHGNRAASSLCGSADLLEALSVNINLNPEQALQCLAACGIVFLFAPLFHPALKHVKEARVVFGRKTYFNIIGPMLNPASATHQVIGIGDNSMATIMGKTLINTGSKQVTIIHGKNGMDEISPEGDTSIYEFNETSRKYKIHPGNFQLKEYPLITLKTESVNENVNVCLSILQNKARESHLNTVLLNSAMGMFAFGEVKTMEEGIKKSREVIQSGKALQKLQEFIKVSNTV